MLKTAVNQLKLTQSLSRVCFINNKYLCYNFSKTVSVPGSISVHKQQDTEKMEELEKNSYYSKYAEKLKHLQSTLPEEFNERLSAYKQQNKAETTVNKSHDLGSKQAASTVHKNRRNLGEIVKIDLLAEMSDGDISEIWRQHHAEKSIGNTLSAVIKASMFQQIQETSKECPLFLYTVPRQDGYEFILGQFDGATSCYFTPLISYQRHAENAPVCMSLHHYPELLAAGRGVVLVRGDIDTDVLSAVEAQCIINQLQMYYTAREADPSGACDGGDGGGAGRYRLLRQFNARPRHFDYTDIVRQLERTVAAASPTSDPHSSDT